jgi:hypothetical protein
MSDGGRGNAAPPIPRSRQLARPAQAHRAQSIYCRSACDGRRRSDAGWRVARQGGRGEARGRGHYGLPYSISSSAPAMTFGSNVSPSAFAASHLITNSNFVGCSGGIPARPCEALNVAGSDGVPVYREHDRYPVSALLSRGRFRGRDRKNQIHSVFDQLAAEAGQAVK